MNSSAAGATSPMSRRSRSLNNQRLSSAEGRRPRPSSALVNQWKRMALASFCHAARPSRSRLPPCGDGPVATACGTDSPVFRETWRLGQPATAPDPTASSPENGPRCGAAKVVMRRLSRSSSLSCCLARPPPLRRRRAGPRPGEVPLPGPAAKTVWQDRTDGVAAAGWSPAAGVRIRR